MRSFLRAAQGSAIVLLVLASPTPAQAYLDPQTGSMVVSAIVAFLATVGMGVQAYWHKILSLFRRRPGPPEGPGREQESREA